MLNNNKKSGALRYIPEGIKHIFLHNGFLKILALLISVVLWAGLISQDETLTRDKTFNDVSVSVTGADTMKRNGYIVTSDLDSLLKGVSITAAVPQQQYENAEASAYNVRVDLSRISGTGEQELRLTSTNSSAYGRVESTNPSSITVEVEDYVVRQRIPVSVSVGEVPAQWYMSTPTVDPTVLTVYGPKSIVETISRARAYVDPDLLEWEEGTLITSVDFELYNRSGEVVSSSLLEITSDAMIIDSVLIEATILPTQMFDVADIIETTGHVANGYEIKDIRVSPESINVAARSEVLEQMTEVALDQWTVSVDGLKDTTVFQIKVQKPSEDAVLSNDTVTVTVEIGEIEPEEPADE